MVVASAAGDIEGVGQDERVDLSGEFIIEIRLRGHG